jgi:hypothetical protein
MRKIFLVVFAAALLGALVTFAIAETQYYGETHHKVDFGKSLRSSGIGMEHLIAKWDATGLKHLEYKLSAHRGRTKLNDVYVVTGGQTLYKRAEHKKLAVDLSFTDLTEMKAFFDGIDFVNPIKPFGYDSEIWWMMTYYDKVKDNGVDKEVPHEAVVIWKMKDNSIDWKPVKQ